MEKCLGMHMTRLFKFHTILLPFIVQGNSISLLAPIALCIYHLKTKQYAKLWSDGTTIAYKAAFVYLNIGGFWFSALYNRIKEEMKMLISLLIQFSKCILSLSMKKVRHQNLLGHELVNRELITEGNNNCLMIYMK
jgi:hypothetical protein